MYSSFQYVNSTMICIYLVLYVGLQLVHLDTRAHRQEVTYVYYAVTSERLLNSAIWCLPKNIKDNNDV